MAEPLQRCTVCGTENDILRFTCAQCGAVLRDRVAALNLFETALDVLIEPKATFVRIARSEQRNYVLLLFSLTGVLLYTVFLAGVGAGDSGIHFGVLVLSYVVGAPAFGIPLLMFSVYIAQRALPVSFTVRRLRIHLGMAAWSLAPVAFTGPVVVVVAFAIFGNFLFSLSFPAAEYKALIFWVLSGVLGAAIATSMILGVSAFKALGMTVAKASAHTALFWLLLAGLLAASIAAIRPLLDSVSFTM